MTPIVACIALGSNLGDRHATLHSALAAIADIPRSRLLARSSFHETSPVGPTAQPDFLNAAATLETSLPPAELLAALLAIEAAHGRDRSTGERWGPRTLDLDLLLYGTAAFSTEGLTVPHPRLHERAFVLEPLAEIAGQTLIPTRGTTVRGALDMLSRGAPPTGSRPNHLAGPPTIEPHGLDRS